MSDDLRPVPASWVDEVDRLTEAMVGVRRTTVGGLANWRYHGRLVARQIDEGHLVIRADFDVRDALLRQFPETFTVPARYRAHMMIVADLAGADPASAERLGGALAAVEEALEAAWRLQRAGR